MQVVKLSKKIGAIKTAKEPGIPVNTLYGLVRKAKIGEIDIGFGKLRPEKSLNIAEDNQ